VRGDNTHGKTNHHSEAFQSPLPASFETMKQKYTMATDIPTEEQPINRHIPPEYAKRRCAHDPFLAIPGWRPQQELADKHEKLVAIRGVHPKPTYPCRVNEANYIRWSKANDSRRG
jgi:hypothetical protein